MSAGHNLPQEAKTFAEAMIDVAEAYRRERTLRTTRSQGGVRSCDRFAQEQQEKNSDNAVTQIGKVVYTAKPHTTGGRENDTSRSSGGRLDVRLSTWLGAHWHQP